MDFNDEKRICPVSGLEISSNKKYASVKISPSYKISLQTIGNHIVFSQNAGDMQFTDIDRYYEIVEELIETENIQKPIIEIRDFSELYGLSPVEQFRKQADYIVNHAANFKAIIYFNVSEKMRNVLETAVLKGPMLIPFFICDDYRDALLQATEIEKNSLKSMKNLSFDMIRFDDRWAYQTDDFSIKNGIIAGRVLFTELQGNARAEYMDEVERVMQNIFHDMMPGNTTYLRIADYSKLKKVPIRSRNRYGKLLNDLNHKYNTSPTLTFICGANRFIRTAMKLYRAFVHQNFAFAATVQEVFDKLNHGYTIPDDTEKTFVLKQKDIDEIIELSGALVWGDTNIKPAKLSESNPLYQLADTFSIVREDLIELRKKDREQTNKLAENVEVTKKLNDDLLKANQKLNKQKEKLEQAQSQLLELNANLEKRISDRTKKLEQTVDELNKTIAELDRFVYSASHDLSAPLKSVLGLVSLARLDMDASNINEYLQHIEGSIKNLEEVIRNLISYSRNSRMAVENKPINLYNLIEEVYANLAFVNDYERVTLQNEISEDIIILSDKTRMNVILHNLISNSIKYADPEKEQPFIKVRCQTMNQEIQIEISDNGLGIEEDHLLKIFTMFYRATEKSSGSGLGLFIVHETLNVLQGKIMVDSKPGLGSCFTISLPITTEMVNQASAMIQ